MKYLILQRVSIKLKIHKEIQNPQSIHFYGGADLFMLGLHDSIELSRSIRLITLGARASCPHPKLGRQLCQ